MRFSLIGCGLTLVATVMASQPGATVAPEQPAASTQAATAAPEDGQRAFVQSYCAGCHNDKAKAGGFSWTSIDLAHPDHNAKQAEDVIRKLRAELMPPAGARRPPSAELSQFRAGLETKLDEAAAARPFYKSPELHRINRREYRSAIRDLLGVDIDVSALLPPDARTGAFDNMSDALTVNPALMQAYIRAADKVARQALGDPQAPTVMVKYDVPKVVNQMRHVQGAPFGTRGGTAVVHQFPADGEYVFK